MHSGRRLPTTGDGAWRSGSNYGSYPCAMTSLAGLALMAGGNTPVEGEYAVNVRRAVDSVPSCANPTGLIARMGEEQRPMYAHGFAMLFLSEAYGMEQDAARQARIRTVLEKAIKLTGQSQSADGGWLYTPDSGGEEGEFLHYLLVESIPARIRRIAGGSAVAAGQLVALVVLSAAVGAGYAYGTVRWPPGAGSR